MIDSELEFTLLRQLKPFCNMELGRINYVAIWRNYATTYSFQPGMYSQ